MRRLRRFWGGLSANDRVAVVAVLAAVVLFAVWQRSSGDPEEPVPRAQRPADASIVDHGSRNVTATTVRRTTTTLSDYERDFDNCRMVNLMMLSTIEDGEAGIVSPHEAFSSARMGLDTMEMLDCGRFSAVAAREMANMDRVLRSVGY